MGIRKKNKINTALVEKLVYSLGLDPRPSGVLVQIQSGAPLIIAPLAQLVEVTALEAGGSRFESEEGHQNNGRLAQR